MKVHNNTDTYNFERTVVAVGVFDGLHLGHRLIISKLIDEARKMKAEALLFTLFPHPKAVLFPDSTPPKYINLPEEKITVAEKLGVEHLMIYPFSKSFGKLTACEFISDILIKKLKAVKIITGYDHSFGSDRQSDLKILQACAEPYGCEVERVGAYIENGVTVSSTLIRDCLSQGKIVEANKFLSYTYSIGGVVVHGDKIGRKIGFPTANIKTAPEKLIAQNGVYAVQVLIDGRLYKGMLNIGNRPTIKGAVDKRTEVYIFDFSGNLYGKEIRVFLHAFVRREMRFESIDKLREQLVADESYTRKLRFEGVMP